MRSSFRIRGPKKHNKEIIYTRYGSTSGYYGVELGTPFFVAVRCIRHRGARSTIFACWAGMSWILTDRTSGVQHPRMMAVYGTAVGWVFLFLTYKLRCFTDALLLLNKLSDIGRARVYHISYDNRSSKVHEGCSPYGQRLRTFVRVNMKTPSPARYRSIIGYENSLFSSVMLDCGSLEER